MAFLAMVGALAFGPAPVIVIQAGDSAVLVMAVGPILAGPANRN